jgi:hypothetical protein
MSGDLRVSLIRSKRVPTEVRRHAMLYGVVCTGLAPVMNMVPYLDFPLSQNQKGEQAHQGDYFKWRRKSVLQGVPYL